MMPQLTQVMGTSKLRVDVTRASEAMFVCVEGMEVELGLGEDLERMVAR